MKTRVKSGVLQKEAERYRSKGRGTIVAVINLYLLIAYWPQFARALWDWVLNYMETNNVSLPRFYIISGVIYSWVFITAIEVCFGIIYYVELDFFERYKVL